MKLRLLSLAVIVSAFAAPARAADVDPLLPADSMQVFKLNIKQILESDILKKYALAQLKQAMEGKDAQKMLQGLGLDPLKDIDNLTGGIWGDDPKDMHGLIILRGKFNAEKLFAAVEKQIEKSGDKISIVKDGDTKLIKIVVDQLPEPVYATMANEKTILIGTEKKLVLDAVNIADDKSAKPALKAKIADLVKEMDDKATMYFVGLSTGKVGDIPPNPLIGDTEKLKEQLKNMESSSMTLRIGSDVALEFTMAMKDKASADDFGATVEGLMDNARGMLKGIGQFQPNAAAIIDDVSKSMKSKVDAKFVKMSLKITGDAIGKAVGSDE